MVRISKRGSNDAIVSTIAIRKGGEALPLGQERRPVEPPQLIEIESLPIRVARLVKEGRSVADEPLAQLSGEVLFPCSWPPSDRLDEELRPCLVVARVQSLDHLAIEPYELATTCAGPDSNASISSARSSASS